MLTLPAARISVDSFPLDGGSWDGGDTDVFAECNASPPPYPSPIKGEGINRE